MYKDICIIGLGRLGGFLAYNLYNSKISNRMILFDYDTVEKENLKNTIYTQKHLGGLKTKSIHEIMKNDPNVIVRNEKFIEGKTDLKNCDLVIDCRDFVEERKNIINIRLYISVRSLIVDCRQNIKKEKEYEGKYLTRVTKIDAEDFSNIASNLIINGIIKDLISEQIIQPFNIDLDEDKIIQLAKQSIYNKEHKQDLIYDPNKFDKKISNLEDEYLSVVHTSKNNNILITIGDKENPLISKKYSKNHFKTIIDVDNECSNLLRCVYFDSYTIQLTKIKENYYLEVLPETGGA